MHRRDFGFTLNALEDKRPHYADPSPAKPVRDWSLMNRINQKGLRPQDKPILITQLSDEEKGLINKYYKELLAH